MSNTKGLCISHSKLTKLFREIFTTPDNGELALDWYDTNSCADSRLNGDEPILLILPGYECILIQPDISYYLYIYSKYRRQFY